MKRVAGCAVLDIGGRHRAHSLPTRALSPSQWKAADGLYAGTQRHRRRSPLPSAQAYTRLQRLELMGIETPAARYSQAVGASENHSAQQCLAIAAGVTVTKCESSKLTDWVRLKRSVPSRRRSLIWKDQADR